MVCKDFILPLILSLFSTATLLILISILFCCLFLYEINLPKILEENMVQGRFDHFTELFYCLRVVFKMMMACFLRFLVLSPLHTHTFSCTFFPSSLIVTFLLHFNVTPPVSSQCRSLFWKKALASQFQRVIECRLLSLFKVLFWDLCTHWRQNWAKPFLISAVVFKLTQHDSQQLPVS